MTKNYAAGRATPLISARRQDHRRRIRTRPLPPNFILPQSEGRRYAVFAVLSRPAPVARLGTSAGFDRLTLTFSRFRGCIATAPQK